MRNNILRFALFGAVATSLLFSSCEKSANDGDNGQEVDRWITISGAKMQTEPGDGDGGTMVFSMTPEEAKNPSFSVNVFDQGEAVRSARTARLQASADGKYLYNIQYTGDDGGVFNKYRVNGGKNIIPEGNEVATADYVSKSPRWLVAAPGVGIAVRGTANPIVYTGTSPNFTYKEVTTKLDAISLDLNDPKITQNSTAEIRLSEAEVKNGYHISRIDAPVVNKKGDKVYVGVQISKYNVASFTLDKDGKPVFAVDRAAAKLAARTLVFDYPSLKNPKLITSTKTNANTNGYRSTMQYVGTDGHVYQATSGEAAGAGGSRILRISSATNDYDNGFEFNLDKALGVTNSYIETWKYVGDGIGFVVYSINGQDGGHIAKIDLNKNTGTKYVIPGEEKLEFGQIQNIATYGDEVFIAVAPVGQDGNIYIFNKKNGDMNVGAKLLNKPGNQYIGVY